MQKGGSATVAASGVDATGVVHTREGRGFVKTWNDMETTHEVSTQTPVVRKASGDSKAALASIEGAGQILAVATDTKQGPIHR